MCGIIATKAELSKREIETAMQKIYERGPDDSRYLVKDGHTFMFNRLAIMGLTEKGMQPFTHGDSVLIANAEIYNYKQIKKELKSKYEFKGESDCEVLLPLYQEIGLELFSVIDAEYAIVMYDAKSKSFIAGRDPIGIRPLFYGYHKESKEIMFSSEVKGIIDLVDKVKAFPPGHYYTGGQFVKYTKITDVEEYSTHDLEETITTIREKLETAIIKRLDSDAPIGFLLSGGLDSSIVCAVSEEHLPSKIRTFSIGMEHDPIDLKYAKDVADYIGSDHTEVMMTKEEVLGSLEEVIVALETYDITTIRASIGMYLISKYIHEKTDIKVLMTGEVSDELFGYKYTDFAPSPEEFQKECKKRIDEIYMYDVLRADRCLAANSLEARVPFGDIDFASYVMRINPLMKMNTYRCGKYLLRKAFEGTYLPKHILYREKAAFSDAVGHSMVDYLKEYAEEKYSDKEFAQKAASFSNIKPISKESLLYREIFDKYYTDHVHLVKDYWMPNKEWDGCDVDDPSARVLSNYGDSGK